MPPQSPENQNSTVPHSELGDRASFPQEPTVGSFGQAPVAAPSQVASSTIPSPSPVYPTPVSSPSVTSSPLEPGMSIPSQQESVVPMPVVQVLSPRGVEYVMLTISLFTGAIGLVSVLLCLINGQTSLISLSLPVSLLIVGLPLFAALFLRLKKAELINPDLKLDQSKRRSTQATQIISFIVSLFTVVGLFVSVFAAISGTAEGIGKAIASAFIVLIVFGGILAYYWRDEHQR